MSMFKPLAASLLLLAVAATTATAADSPHLGKPITDADIKPWDITVLPDGTNLPVGSGTAAQGAKLYVDKGCSLCHGPNGKGGPQPDAGRQSIAYRGRHRLDQDHRQFLGMADDLVRLHPPRHAVDLAAHAQR